MNSDLSIGLLVLEQCCDKDGLLLPWDMRGVRLRSAPPEGIADVHFLWEFCQREVYIKLTQRVFWMVRSERARRRGTPEWSPKDSLPRLKEEPAFFRPSRLTVRRHL